MSDIVSPRIENYYLHPKKYAWRADTNAFNSDQGSATPEGGNIASLVKENYKMVISSKFKTDNVPQNGTSHEVDQKSPMRIMSQDMPLDFSVKTVCASEHGLDSDSELSFSESPIHGDNKMSHNVEVPPVFTINHSSPFSPYNGKISSSTVPIYNGVSKFVRPKQRHMNKSSPTSHTNIQPPSPRLYVENGHGNQLSMQETSIEHNSSSQHDQLRNSNYRRQELNERASFDANGAISPRHSPTPSRENSPEQISYARSILHDALAAAPGDRSQLRGQNSYIHKINPHEASTTTLQSPVTSTFLATNSVPSAHMISPDTGSLLQSGGALISGSNPLMPAASFAFLNGFGFAPNAINGMNSFGNGSLLLSSMDTRMPLTPGSGDKKQGKPVRPFKAITNELLYGIPSMGLTSMNPTLQNGGYFREYCQAPAKDAPDPPKSSPVPKRDSPEASANSAINSSPPCSSNGGDLKPDAVCSGDSNCSYLDASTSGIETAEATSNSNGNNRKRIRTLPEEQKDEAYWERRRKNNQAAKRSRDARRQKEDMVAQQAWIFRDQNIKLRFQITGLEEQHQRLQLQYRAMVEQCQSLELQLQLTKENAARNRCGKCGSRIHSDITDNNYCESKKNE